MITYEEVSVALSYDRETGHFRWRLPRYRVSAGQIAGCLTDDGYWVITFARKTLKAHRLAWLLDTGSWPTRHIDHINGVRSDNRIANLREATASENRLNAIRRSDSKTGVKGVTRPANCNRWQAKIGVNGQRIHLGYFKTIEEARAAYLSAVANHHGDFALEERKDPAAGLARKVADLVSETEEG